MAEKKQRTFHLYVVKTFNGSDTLKYEDEFYKEKEAEECFRGSLSRTEQLNGYYTRLCHETYVGTLEKTEESTPYR